MDSVKIGKLIAKLRKEKGLTQQELGDIVGVGFRAVSKWERGIMLPDICIIQDLATILGVKVDCLLSGSNYPKDINKKTLKEKIKLSTFSDHKINKYKKEISNKKENYTVLKDIGIAVIVEVIVLNILNELSLKNSIIILTIGFLCIGISNKLDK